jgi:hypothetical protein
MVGIKHGSEPYYISPPAFAEFGFKKKKSTRTDVSKNPYSVHVNASCKKCSVWFSLSAAEELCA